MEFVICRIKKIAVNSLFSTQSPHEMLLTMVMKHYELLIRLLNTQNREELFLSNTFPEQELFLLITNTPL